MRDFYGVRLNCPLMLGTARYPSPAVLADAVKAAGVEIVTVSLRRESGGARAGQQFWDLIRGVSAETGARVLPNTAGCRTVKEAVTTAQMAREVFDTPWIKLEVTGGDDLLEPDLFALVEAARILCADGFEVFPYTTADLGAAARLLDAGCRVLMPWGAPIGSGRGLADAAALAAMRRRFPDTALVVDAGIGRPSHAAQAMELGFDAVLVNTAVAEAGDPAAMARAFALAVEAGRLGAQARPMDPRDVALASSPLTGLAFR